MKAFRVWGIEAEYMILDKETFRIRNEAEFILKSLSDSGFSDDAVFGSTALSNELTSHLIELKCLVPMTDLEEIETGFADTLREVNRLLDTRGAVLCGTSAHPTMNPYTETKLWPYGYSEVYRKYNEVFDCRGHGWANLQSVHINLPYGDEEEFGRLHAAIRLVLPLFPFLCASSPMVDGSFSPYPDRRLKFYEQNQNKVPSITGRVIPENVFTFQEYNSLLQKIYSDISPYDPGGILQRPWLNSRGAIPKFDLGAIEIRVMDIQESPVQDFSLISFFTELIKELFYEKWIGYEEQKLISAEDLAEVYLNSNAYENKDIPGFYKKIFDSDADTYLDLSRELYNNVRSKLVPRYQLGIETILGKGNVAGRMRSFIEEYGVQAMMKKLTELLSNNERLD